MAEALVVFQAAEATPGSSPTPSRWPPTGTHLRLAPLASPTSGIVTAGPSSAPFAPQEARSRRSNAPSATIKAAAEMAASTRTSIQLSPFKRGLEIGRAHV